MDNDYISVTKIAGDEVTQEQVDRLCNRYYRAGQYCSGKDVVETACGLGQGLGYLSGISRSLEAGDYSEKILSIARRHDSMIWDDCLRQGMNSLGIRMNPFGIWMGG